MKIQYMSDLHLEGGYKEFEDFQVENGVGALVLAGDIVTAKTLPLLSVFEKVRIPILCVLGNHEYYGHHDPTRLTRHFRSHLSNNLPNTMQLLDRQIQDIGDVRFFGVTMWPDITSEDSFLVKDYISDFRGAIYDFSIMTCKEKAREDRDYLRHYLMEADRDKKKGYIRKVVVVSHFSPSYRAMDPRFAKSAMNSYFHNQLDDTILQFQPDLWIYGHTHANIDFEIGNTKVVTNQRGYISHPNEPTCRPFNKGCVVEV